MKIFMLCWPKDSKILLIHSGAFILDTNKAEPTHKRVSVTDVSSSAKFLTRANPSMAMTICPVEIVSNVVLGMVAIHIPTTKGKRYLAKADITGRNATIGSISTIETIMYGHLLKKLFKNGKSKYSTIMQE
ncbi:MAG: hypothetical protein MJY89_06610 [Bacteroidales bacterium]|nr:hypothetical protein [Bacteroidales bacterium]